MSTSMMTPPPPSPEPSTAPAEEVITDGRPVEKSRPRTERLRRRWDGVPLRARLVGILVVLLVAALTATGLGAQLFLKRYLAGQVDQALSPAAVNPVVLMAGRGGRMPDPDDQVPSQYVVLQVLIDGGTRLTLTRQVQQHSGLAPRLPNLTIDQA